MCAIILYSNYFIPNVYLQHNILCATNQNGIPTKFICINKFSVEKHMRICHHHFVLVKTNSLHFALESNHFRLHKQNTHRNHIMILSLRCKYNREEICVCAIQMNVPSEMLQTRLVFYTIFKLDLER